MAKVLGVPQVRKRLKEMRDKYQQGAGEKACYVGHSQRYALHVHETNRDYKVGQWKFLQAAFRHLQRKLPDIIVKVANKTGNIGLGLTVAGLRVQRISQELCPVDTGALKASAYTALEKDHERVRSSSFAKAEALRINTLRQRIDLGPIEGLAEQIEAGLGS